MQAGPTRPRADVLATALAFTTTIVAQVASIPILKALLSAHGFAMAQVVISALAWAPLLPLGADRALKQGLATARAVGRSTEDVLGGARLLLFGLAAVATLALLLGLPGLLGALFLDPIPNRPFPAEHLLVPAAALALFGLGGFGREALLAAHRGRAIAWLQIGITLTQLAGLVGLAVLDPEPMDLTVGWVLGVWMVPHGVAGLVALHLGGLLAPPRTAHLDDALRLGRAGLGFLAGALAANVLIASDFAVLARIAEADAIVLYTVCSRFTAAFALLAAGMLGLWWPRWTEALARGDRAAMHADVRRHALAWLGLGVLVAVGLAPILTPLCRLWLGDPTFTVPLRTTLLLGAALAARGWTDPWAIAWLAAARPGPLAVVALAQAAVAIPLQVLLFPTLGVDAMFMGALAGSVLVSSWVLPLGLGRWIAPPATGRP